MIEQRTLQFEDGGSIPTSPHELRIKEGKFSDFADLLKEYHYKSNHMGGGISHHLCLYHRSKVMGGVVIGKMRHPKSYSSKAVELRRMVLHPDCPKNTASYFLSKVIWWLKKNTDVDTVLTFADQSVGHKGTCYKGANFEFVKETPPTKHVYWKGKRYHPRSLNIERPYSYELRKAVENGEAEVRIEKPKLLYKYEIIRNA